MPAYPNDLQDIEFNLFEVLKIQDNKLGLEESDLKDILIQFQKYLENEVFPHRSHADEVGLLYKEGKVETPESYKKTHAGFYSNGWFGIGVTDKWEGVPVPEALTNVCTSLLNGADTSFSMYPGLSKAALNLLIHLANPEQQKMYIPKMMDGSWGGTMCLTEPMAGSDVGALKTVATPTKDGHYKIKGSKIFISSGENDLYENIVHLVLARTPDAPEGVKGLSLFIVPKFKVNNDSSLGDSNDVFCAKIEDKMGLHAQATCQLNFGDQDNCEGWIVGKEGEGIMKMFHMMNEARLLCGVQGESQANLAFHLSKKYAEERSQFGHEIIKHPDVKRMLLKMRAMSRGLRSLCLYTANLFDQEGVESEIALLTPVCKAYCSDQGFEISVDAIQVHGGYGYCREYGVEQLARDAEISKIYEGTNGIQAIDFLQRKILKDQGKTFLEVGKKISQTLKTDLAREFEDERKILIENQRYAEAILGHFAKLAQGKKFDAILEHATDFLSFCGTLAVSWRLLESACIAKQQLQSKPADQDYLESKVVDFKVFCQHYLVKNASIAHMILNFGQSLKDFKV